MGRSRGVLVLVGAEIIMALLGMRGFAKYRCWGRRQVAYKEIRVNVSCEVPCLNLSSFLF